MYYEQTVEKDPLELINASVSARSKSNLKDMWKGIKQPEFYRSVLFFIIMGSLVPNFTTFLYYYQVEISGFTQLTYSLLQLLSYITLFLSTFLFQGLLKGY